MRLLDRYFLKELIIPLVYCLCGFLIFWLTFDLFGELEDIQEASLSLGEIVTFYSYKLPELLVVVMPVALLLAMLYTLTNHSRHNELIAVQAAGVGMWRICLIYLAVGGLFGATLFWVNEHWGAGKDASIEAIVAARGGADGQAAGGAWIRPFLFENHGGGRSWNIEGYNWATSEMVNPHVYWKLDDQLTVRLIAEGGSYTNGMWTFRNLKIFRFDPEKSEERIPDTETHPIKAVKEFNETPQQLRSEYRISNLSNKKLAKEARVSLREIEDYLTLHPDLPDSQRARLDTQFHGRLAWPWTCVVVVLIAIPFGGGSGRRNAFVGVASSIGICFCYFILMRVGLALGTGGTVPPWLAAWFPNILFGGGAGLLIARMR